MRGGRKPNKSDDEILVAEAKHNSDEANEALKPDLEIESPHRNSEIK